MVDRFKQCRIGGDQIERFKNPVEVLVCLVNTKLSYAIVVDPDQIFLCGPTELGFSHPGGPLTRSGCPLSMRL